MTKKILTLLLVAFLGGCALSPGGDEAAAETSDPGKADGYGYEIVYATYENEHRVDRGELSSLTLSEARPDELPAPHYEGRYTLTEVTAEGTRDSAGFFNVYRYDGRMWIRFLDAETQRAETTYEKYSWVYFDGTLVMRGAGADTEFFLEPPLNGTKVDCTLSELFDDNVFEEGLSEEEYPDVSIEQNAATGAIDVSIGAHSFDTDDGDAMTFGIDEGVAKVLITWGDDQLTVTGPSAGEGNGEVLLQEPEGRPRRIATLRCTGQTGSTGPTPEPETRYECGGFDNGPFGIGASDALRKTPAELVAEVTLANAESVLDGHALAELDVIAAQTHGSRAELFAAVDDGTINFYEVSYYQAAYVWFQFFYASTEAGYVFDMYGTEPAGIVSDGDIRGCRDAACDDESARSPVSDTSADLLAEPRASLVMELGPESRPDALLEAQIREAIEMAAWADDLSAPVGDLIADAFDGGEGWVYGIDDGAYDWIMWYGGDNEVGVMFQGGTTIPVATVGDAQISGCMPVD